MKQFNYKITDENGIHARPAGQIVKEAQKFSSEITLEANGKTASVKKLFALIGLGVKFGDEVTIKVDGKDESEAITAMETFLQENF